MRNSQRTFAKRFLSVACFVLFLSASAAFAQTSTITYQGRLTDGGTPPTGTLTCSSSCTTPQLSAPAHCKARRTRLPTRR